jgi:glucose/mannose-6-phosphate isomerase
MNYSLPAYADKKTLVIAISYSGNTEETVSSFIDAVKKQCMVISVSSGGILSKFSKILGIPIIKIPEGFPPRCAIPYLFFPIVVSMKKMGVSPDINEEIKDAIYVLKRTREDVRPENPSSKNQAKKLALGIKSSIPIIYGSGFYRGVALRLKNQFNENSKTPSKYEVFPELNHNEIAGWMGVEQFDKYFSVILLRDKDERPEIKERIKVTKEIVLDRKFNKVMEIYAHGETRLAKMLSTMYIGDFTSFYLAILYGIDPTPIDIISSIKNRLNKKNNKLSEFKARLNEIMT